MGDYRERIAAVQHAIWSHWMRYLFSVCPPDSFGNGIIPAEKAQRWQRQMNTDYADLTDQERESDRHQADKVLAERDAEIARLGTEVEDMVGQIAYLNRQLNEANQIVRAGEAERKALAAQVAELQAWKAAVPVVGIKRLFRDAPYDASYADEVWQWIEKYTLNR